MFAMIPEMPFPARLALWWSCAWRQVLYVVLPRQAAVLRGQLAASPATRAA